MRLRIYVSLDVLVKPLLIPTLFSMCYATVTLHFRRYGLQFKAGTIVVIKWCTLIQRGNLQRFKHTTKMNIKIQTFATGDIYLWSLIHSVNKQNCCNKVCPVQYVYDFLVLGFCCEYINSSAGFV